MNYDAIVQLNPEEIKLVNNANQGYILQGYILPSLKAGGRIGVISPASQHLQVLFKGSGE